MQLQPAHFLLFLLEDHDLLPYVFIGRALLSNVDADWCGDYIAYQKLHGLFHGCSEEKRLPVFSGLTDYRSDLLFKTKRKHTISLIKYQISNPDQICCLFLDHFYQSPRRCNQDIHSCLQGLPLLMLILSSKNTCYFQVIFLRILLSLYINLLA